MNDEGAHQLSRLSVSDPAVRARAADELGDRLERPDLDPVDADPLLRHLVRAAMTETDPTALEAELHAVLARANQHDLPIAAVGPLTMLLPGLTSPELIDYCLSILASTHDPAAAQTIQSFIDNPDPTISAVAKEALTELNGTN